MTPLFPDNFHPAARLFHKGCSPARACVLWLARDGSSFSASELVGKIPRLGTVESVSYHVEGLHALGLLDGEEHRRRGGGRRPYTINASGLAVVRALEEIMHEQR